MQDVYAVVLVVGVGDNVGRVVHIVRLVCVSEEHMPYRVDRIESLGIGFKE